MTQRMTAEQWLADRCLQYDLLAAQETQLLALGGVCGESATTISAWYHFHEFGPLAPQHRRENRPCSEHKTFQDF